MTSEEVKKIVFNQLQEGKSNTDYTNMSITNKDYAESPVCSDPVTTNDMVNNPPHYQSKSPSVNISCIDAMRAAFGDREVAIWCKLNAFKYNWRCEAKNGAEDVRKDIWNLNKYLELNGKQ